MELRELRIGNYYHWSAEGKDYPMQVTAKDFSNDNHRNFEPILMTEEWLIKFGFVKIRLKNSESFFWNINGIDLMHSDFTLSWFNNIEVKYVHQLQNIVYFLTKEELTLKP